MWTRMTSAPTARLCRAVRMTSRCGLRQLDLLARVDLAAHEDALWQVGDAAQRASLPAYSDGGYDSSLCLPHASEEEMYRKGLELHRKRKEEGAVSEAT